MIFGIGTDIVDVKRIKKMKSIDSFAKKILGDNEHLKYAALSESKKIFFVAKQFSTIAESAEKISPMIRARPPSFSSTPAPKLLESDAPSLSDTITIGNSARGLQRYGGFTLGQPDKGALD